MAKDEGDDKKWSRRVEKRDAGSGRYVSKKDRDKDREATMPTGNDGDRYVVKHDDGWAVKKENAQRASGVFDTQKEAIARAREIVDKTSRGNGEVRIQGENGKFRASDSGRNNESPAKDKK